MTHNVSGQQQMVPKLQPLRGSSLSLHSREDVGCLSVLFCSRWGFGLNLDVQVGGEHTRLPTSPRAGRKAYNKDKDPLFPIADQVETQCHCISSWHMPGGRAEFQIIFCILIVCSLWGFCRIPSPGTDPACCQQGGCNEISSSCHAI